MNWQEIQFIAERIPDLWFWLCVLWIMANFALKAFRILWDKVRFGPVRIKTTSTSTNGLDGTTTGIELYRRGRLLGTARRVASGSGGSHYDWRIDCGIIDWLEDNAKRNRDSGFHSLSL